MWAGTILKHSHADYVSFIGYSKPDGNLAQKIQYGRIEVLRHPAIAVAKAIATVAKLNKKKREDGKHMIATIYGLCVFFKSSPGNKKHCDSE